MFADNGARDEYKNEKKLNIPDEHSHRFDRVACYDMHRCEAVIRYQRGVFGRTAAIAQ